MLWLPSRREGDEQEGEMKEAFNTLRSRSLPGAVVFAIALLIGHGMALANWEFARWGMTGWIQVWEETPEPFSA